MLTNRLYRRTARLLSRGGFTLVELLVVIGIIAILAGVALGPITNGIKKAQQSSGVQTCRTLGLAEFQYANDNNQTYPGGADSSVIAKLLLVGNYVSDPGIFYIGGSQESKYTGTAPTTGIAVSNVSYDFVVQTSGSGLNSNTPDQCPTIMSCLNAAVTLGTGATPGAVTTSQPFGSAGCAIAYHSNNAKFIISTGTTSPYPVAITDASAPALGAKTVQGGQ